MASPKQILEVTRDSLSTLRDIENDLDALYAVSVQMYNQGLLTETIRSEVHRIRDETYLLENAMYVLLTSVLRFSMPTGFAMSAILPRPERRADLPAANLGHPPATPLPVPTTGSRYSVNIGSRTTSGVWAVVAVVAVALVVAVAIVGVVATQELFQFLRESRRLREETRRYLGQLIDSQARLQLCLDSGRTLEECFDLVPQPKPPGATTSGGFPWGAVLGTVAVGGLAWLVFSERAEGIRARLLPSGTDA